MLIYIHGFNSSAQSFKAGMLRAAMARRGCAHCYACPELSHRPSAAMAQLQTLLAAHDPHLVTLVGSSLGGFYATWLAEHCGVRAVLVNPAVRPYDLLASQLGPQTNLYTAAPYELTPAHLAELRALEVGHITPARYVLITAAGDEVLDYRDGVRRYAGCEQVVVSGGDHGFSEFSTHVDRVIAIWERGRV